MHRFYLFVISVFLNLIFTPTAVLAGSCLCLGGGSPECLFTGSVFSQNDCETKYPGVTDCNYCNSTDCNTNCVTDGLTRIDKTCTTDAECKQSMGEAHCYGKYCWLNALAYESKQAGNISFMGVARDLQLKNPMLEIRIPGVDFRDVQDTLDSEGYIHVPYLADYLAAIYKFGITAASLVAVIVIILNGFRITVSAGGEDKNTGIKNIGKAITGLFILWSSYALFYTINPALTQFKAFRVKYVEPVILEHEEEIPANPQQAAGTNVSAITFDNVVSGRNVKVADTLLTPLNTVAQDLKSQGIQLYISSGVRSLESQLSLIRQNCQNPPGSTTCNPYPDKPTTCILKDNNPNNCPHTTGRAVDVWGMKDGKQCIKQAACSSNPQSDACRKDPCQKAVIEAMIRANFCNLRSEAWHFEYPQMSASCTKTP